MDFATMYRQLGDIHLKARRKDWTPEHFVKSITFEDDTGNQFFAFVSVFAFIDEAMETTFVPSQLDIDASDWEWVIE